MKVQLNIAGTPNEIKEAIGALSTLGGVKVFISAKEEKQDPYPGLNRSAVMRNLIFSFKDKGITVDETSLSLHVKFPLISIPEWKEIITRMTNPKYTSYAIKRVKGYHGYPGTDKLFPAEE